MSAVERWASAARMAVEPRFAAFEAIARGNTVRILEAFRRHRISAAHMAGSTGYGYGDIGRDAFEAVFADTVGAQAALARPAIASGTHALAVALTALLRPGQTLVYASGAPYDTLDDVIGHKNPRPGSLAAQGVAYREVSLRPGGAPDESALDELLSADKSVGLVAIQRSRGYAWRPALSLDDIERVAGIVRRRRPEALIMVDNCYGEFVGAYEPTAAGADVIAGSFIKNPGGGLAPTGGYIAGTREVVERCAARLYAPGVGGEIGSYEGGYRLFFQGLYMAPHVVLQAMKTANYAGALFAEMGYKVSPAPDAFRGDIIQAIELGTPEALMAFCAAIQEASPVDSHVIPEPWDMPGYSDRVIMAAGAFVQGSSIELSADGPMAPPYVAYLQGGITWEHGAWAVTRAAERVAAACGLNR